MKLICIGDEQHISGYSIGVAFVAFFQIISSDPKKNQVYLTIIVSVIGYFFSLGRYFVNRGSKYWQENWERHVKYLEQKIQGPLFSYVKIPDQRFWNLTDSYPFSVSRVNQLLNVLMILFWLVAFEISLIKTFTIANNELCLAILIITVATFLLFGFTFVFYRFSKSSIKRNYGNVKDKGLFLKV